MVVCSSRGDDDLALSAAQQAAVPEAMDAVHLTRGQHNTVISAGALPGPMHRHGRGPPRSVQLTPGGAMSVLWISDDRDVRQKVSLELHKPCLAAKQDVFRQMQCSAKPLRA